MDFFDNISSASLRQKLDKLRIPFDDIVSATNQFADDNLIKQGSIADVYKGRLCSKEQMDVIIRRFRSSSGLQHLEFLKEVYTLSCVNHTNTLSFVGFCDDNGEMMMVLNYENNGSLDRYLSDPNLTWFQRLKICLGAAHALRYIHNDIEGHIPLGYHHDIKSSKILLDKDWEAKLFCFGFQIKYDVVFRSPSSYKDPTTEGSWWKWNHMSDVYSFGVILFEVLFERKAQIGDDESLVSVATRLYEEGKLEDIINPDLRKQMHPQPLSIFSQIAYDCVKKRSSMVLIVERLEEALTIISKHERLEKQYAYLKIPLDDIILATENFASTYCIRSHRDYMVYKADLNHFYIETRGKSIGEFRGPVTIKRNISKNYELVVNEFIADMEMFANRQHPNIVSLVGFCWEGCEMILIFESSDLYVSLADHLGSTGEKTNLTWTQRIRICLDIAHGLEFFHKNMEADGSTKIHQRIQSTNVLLDEKWNAKIATFNLYEHDYTDVYFSDAEYARSQKKTEINSFGVVLFEILCGSLAYDPKITQENFMGLVPIARWSFEEGLLKNMVDPKIMEEVHEHSDMTGHDQRSLGAYINIAYQCLSENEAERPTPEGIIYSLKRALTFHEKSLEGPLKVRLSDIKAATNNFTEKYIGEAGFGVVYRAELDVFDKLHRRKHTVAIKRNVGKKSELGNTWFLAELEIIRRCVHPNIISLLGYCFEDSENILVYEYAANGSLDDYLEKGKLSKLPWARRLKMCLDIAYGLSYLQTPDDDKTCILHCDIKSGNILLGENLEVKIADFGLSIFHPNNHLSSTIKTKNYVGTNVYMDPEYKEGKLTLESDIYSFGVVLLEILSGKVAYHQIYTKENGNGIAPVVRQRLRDGKLMEMVDIKIMEEAHEIISTIKFGPSLDSLDAFFKVACKCVAEAQADRPRVEEVINGLKEAIDFQHEETLEHMKIQLSDIKAATNNFTETYIGKGGYGVVYKAELVVFDKTHRRNCTVAIKRIPGKTSELRNTGFFDELEIIRRCDHPNIISLLGFCFEDSENIIVSEYAANGSLDEYLETGKLSKLPWDRRLNMCLDIAYGLSYLHTPDVDKKCIIHRDIKSGNILLGENLEVKIADFGLSIFHPKNHPSSTINTEHCAGTHVYLDPEYQEGKLKLESDIYSYGVVLFEILSGKVAYDRIFTKENGNGIAPVARQRFKDDKLTEMVDIKIMEEAHELSSTIKVGPSRASLNEFFKVAFKCVAEAQAGRLKMKEIIDGLKKAIDFQKNRKDTLEILPEDIRLGGKYFSATNLDTKKGYNMYNGEVLYGNKPKPVFIKRMSKCCLEPPGCWREFEITFKHKHENVLGLIGYCKKKKENFIIYENAINKSLDMHLGNATLTWIKRLKIGIDIANGLKFLHGTDERQDVVIHRDLKSSNILLIEDWKAKVCGFDVSIIYPNNHNIHYADDGIRGSPGYCDPMYLETRILTKESDIYSLGVILFELFCGRLACTDSGNFLDSLVKDQYDLERPDKLVFECIREQIEWESLVTFTKTAFQCLHDDREYRPTAAEVVVQLQQALELQEAHKIWGAKLPRNYNEILELSKTPELFSTMKRKDIYNKLSEGIPLQEGKLWYSIGVNGERNEMIPARVFSYKNRWSHRWQTIQDSRFKNVAEMLDVSNLNIQIKRGPQLLPPSVSYSVHLVFKFCRPRKSRAKRMYVNLKYKMGKENLNSYFATYREDGWMMIELGRFSSNKEKTDIKLILESFSRCYCDSRAIYIEGIEFRAVDKVERVEIVKSEEIEQPILKSNSEMTKFTASEMASMRQEVYAKKRVLYNNSKAKLVYSNSSSGSRFEGMELLRQSAYSINWKIGSQKVSTNKDNVCCLVFKVSENCCGLHCPVLVRNLDRWKSKGTIYFRYPGPWNVHETDRLPKERRDGWMEVIVWIYKSNYKLRKNSLHVKLKLICYEGTMSGLIIGGLEFRPMGE